MKKATALLLFGVLIFGTACGKKIKDEIRGNGRDHEHGVTE